MSDWEDTCEMYGLKINDPDALDKLLNMIHGDGHRDFEEEED